MYIPNYYTFVSLAGPAFVAGAVLKNKTRETVATSGAVMAMQAALTDATVGRVTLGALAGSGMSFSQQQCPHM